MSRYTVRSRSALGCGLAAALLLAAACGGDDGPGSQAAREAGADLTGVPVKVMTVTSVDTPGVNHPEVNAAAQVAAAAINAAGGINGGRLEVLTCNDQNTPDGAQACAQQAVREGVAAVLGSATINGETLYPTLEAAGIAVLGLTGPNAKDMTSPMSYPVHGGVPSQMVGAGIEAGQSGCASLGIVGHDIPAAQQAVKMVETGFKATGKTKVTTTPVPQSATDYAPVVAASTRDTDCVAFVMGTQSVREYMAAFTQAGKTQRIVSFAGALAPDIIESSGGAAEGGLIVTGYPMSSDPAWTAYHAAVDKYMDNKAEFAAGGFGIDSDPPYTTWVSYQVFASIARGMDSVTAANIVKALDSSTGVETGGLTPTLRWSPPFEHPRMPRLFMRSVRFQVVRDGRIAAFDDAWHDVSPALLGQPLQK